MPRKIRLFTIGHSTHPLERFLALLAEHRIGSLVDIRRFPGSRKFPHFNQKCLSSALQEAGIEYHWLEHLGGRRGKSRDASFTLNLGLRNTAFRNYADYMRTHEFREGLSALLRLARQKRSALMCAEGLFWRCHRRLVSDVLIAKQAAVQHIMPNGELRPHKLTTGAVIKAGTVTYPAEKSLFDMDCR